MILMDKEQAVFEQLILSDFKKSSSTALETFNNSTIIKTSNSNNNSTVQTATMNKAMNKS